MKERTGKRMWETDLDLNHLFIQMGGGIKTSLSYSLITLHLNHCSVNGSRSEVVFGYKILCPLKSQSLNNMPTCQRLLISNNSEYLA